MIVTENIRIMPDRHGEAQILRFDARDPKTGWRTVLSHRAGNKHRPWEKEEAYSVEDLEVAPSNSGSTSIFTETDARDPALLIRRGAIGGHRIEERITVESGNRLRVEVRDQLTGPDVCLARLMNHYYFVPDGRAMGYALPLDFAWIPGLHDHENHVAGEWFFRSPCVIVSAHGLYAVIVPDLDLMQEQPDLPHALDLRAWHHAGSGETYGLPRISYGICRWKPDGHVLTARDEPAPVSGTEIAYAFDLMIGASRGPESIVAEVTELLWDKYGTRYLKDIRPQVMPFEEYGRQYTYRHELNLWAKPVSIGSQKGYGIENTWRRGVNYHAWENDFQAGFGLMHYGRKWGDGDLLSIAEGMIHLRLSSPRRNGAFPCIYNVDSASWEGAMYWTSWPAHPADGYDLQSMGVTAWWMLYWYEQYPDLRRGPDLLNWIMDFCRFLVDAQLPSGAIPTYFDRQLNPSPQLKEDAPTAIGGAVLAKTARIVGDPEMERAAVRAGEFMLREIFPRMKFQDFELFYSCAPRPLYWVDPLNGIPPVNTLAVQWAADHCLALFRLTEDARWLQEGEFSLDLLSLFQQVWAPNRFGKAYLFGGFGVMNCDGEWNDGRQSRMVPTYADYYLASGRIEYLERAVAASRAAFAAMDMEENHANGINDYRVTMAEQVRVEPGIGLSPESLMHGDPRVHSGEGGGWTGFNWGPGGGLSATAYLERIFGSVWVNVAAQEVTAIDGVTAEASGWTNGHIELFVRNALQHLASPYTTPRKIVVKFGNPVEETYRIRLNDQDIGALTKEALEQGLETEI
ncbi:MAG: hypothetical protein OXU48_02390 [candidate division Zixibacteria bacterium]|nr:hypothetical protein [candidate division Zixibacteria bacterium]